MIPNERRKIFPSSPRKQPEDDGNPVVETTRSMGKGTCQKTICETPQERCSEDETGSAEGPRSREDRRPGVSPVPM